MDWILYISYSTIIFGLICKGPRQVFQINKLRSTYTDVRDMDPDIDDMDPDMKK